MEEALPPAREPSRRGPRPSTTPVSLVHGVATPEAESAPAPALKIPPNSVPPLLPNNLQRSLTTSPKTHLCCPHLALYAAFLVEARHKM